MNRFEVMTLLLEERKLFKLVCGAGNEDAQEVYRLVFLYTLAGAKCFDVSANCAVVEHAVLGVRHAMELAEQRGQMMTVRPFINVSIGMKGDPHVRKAVITDLCVHCGECLQVCSARAISDTFEVQETRCIGCGNCESACTHGSIAFRHTTKDLDVLLRECKKCGAEQFELHAAVPDSETIFDEWQMINEILTDNYVSMCLDRYHLGDFQLCRRIVRAKEVSGNRFIVQADGVPMSGGVDDYNTTLQAVAIADIVMKSKLDVKVLLSGGTNSFTADLARTCGVNFHGVSIGTFARKIVAEYVHDKNFERSYDFIEEPLSRAAQLVKRNIGEPLW